ncbi:hypothetical protein CQA37_06065 [Helicobacter sp. MIT 99-10781]|uniref:hypothetical protein n=1 Tax=unclassified Helicobacter TaxID=2593540 RepID=UPI000E39E3A0|nr:MULTISPECIES: hypothetical protein [unclassified Helicobacter]RDU54176.1 hypothetical protein CQA37_06065 [Helicobacter sp. MIT 99-10781]
MKYGLTCRGNVEKFLQRLGKQRSIIVTDLLYEVISNHKNTLESVLKKHKNDDEVDEILSLFSNAKTQKSLATQQPQKIQESKKVAPKAEKQEKQTYSEEGSTSLNSITNEFDMTK